MKLVTALTIALTTLVAGCFNETPSPETRTDDPTASPNPDPTATTGPGGNWTIIDEPKVPANELLLTNCFATTAFINYPAPYAPGERPDGWGPDSLDDGIASVSIMAFKCDRIAIADYERGPVHLLLDLHGNVQVPPDCEGENTGATHHRILRHLVLDDAEIAAYLQTRFGVPILLGAFSQTDRDAPAGIFHDWSWSIGGDAPSVVTVFDAELNDLYPTLRNKLFWQVGSGIGSLRLEADGNGPNFEPPANGTIRPPMLLASDTGGRFIGNGAWFDGMHAKGEFARYADLECKEPLP